MKAAASVSLEVRKIINFIIKVGREFTQEESLVGITVQSCVCLRASDVSSGYYKP